MRQYTGRMTDDGAVVLVDGAPLPPGPSLALRNHSPTGFAWGYGGSGPAQLALALLLDVSGDPDVAQLHYQDFKAQVVAALPQQGQWDMTEEGIIAWLTRAQAKAAGGAP